MSLRPAVALGTHYSRSQAQAFAAGTAESSPKTKGRQDGKKLSGGKIEKEEQRVWSVMSVAVYKISNSLSL
jgi:hypothetical protein